MTSSNHHNKSGEVRGALRQAAREFGKIKQGATYEDLPYLIGLLKQSAIDAYVREKIADTGFLVSFSYDNSSYQITFPNGSETISRPGSDGKGGGKGEESTSNPYGPVSITENDYTTAFDQVREEIDAIVKPWTKLPDPDLIDQVMRDCRRAISPLSTGPLSSKGQGTAGGLIQIKLSSIHDELVQMYGNTIATFKSKVIENLQHIIGNLSMATVHWGAALGSEQGIFAKARESAVEFILKGIDSFSKIAQQGAGEIKATLEIGKLALDGFLLFSGNVVAATTSQALGLGLQALQAKKDYLDPQTHVDESAESYDDAIRALSSAFDELNMTVTKAENAVNDNLIHNMGEMHKQKEAYDLKLAAIKSSDVNPSEKLNINQSRIDSISQLSKPVILEELNKVWPAIDSIDMTPCVTRPEGIGRTIYGPSSKFHDFKWLLYDLICRLIEETENAFKDFELAIEYIQQEDSTTKAALDSMTGRVNRNEGPDPWQKRD